MHRHTFYTNTPAETEKIGHIIGQTLVKRDIVALIGDLGAGKTCLTRGLALGLGLPLPQKVTSPSYTLINEYEGYTPIYHIDLYRIDQCEDVWDLGLDEYLEGEGVCIIEWANIILQELPSHTIEIKLSWLDENRRSIETKNTVDLSTYTSN
ncbi:tRNA (adenosine(37)-N6)-threonylcarbamoyltransferase complex ATPase subunit type 1 TsaE [Candidatus Poribacteria bacterium]|jgi:tRNA threonylcarbamoyladenosine biosynthesis protein TsaE|nr:tRNA (adenosine(37)-N6)-threonylcarbamoyltransferase complex ATPase subunit type 1 TsaE [Candidatus Poribacteria bacterium]MBF75754.1 tRNA (adenosine(37)-N6)-threonylcarbamoyltransferase complex ATPase subunit type 1 TsaE [Candidatus Poribacteria bacterium]MCH2575717.1 tRNA (adenosine(37)-N6)-threonylcarbamoyltransferase complex ATPase subunit type 1 TsaE [Candidatus Poribacteria bacterium]OUT56825.1 MAG: tRNA (adenosine(37)-N6)-threonylcarbamoyltransferase complex ATPase subunit type 1 TsaE |tara:strand:- start:1997 stop:2452 length:456 start_codon:yes stop_codon:yes gene_type:complete